MPLYKMYLLFCFYLSTILSSIEKPSKIKNFEPKTKSKEIVSKKSIFPFRRITTMSNCLTVLQTNKESHTIVSKILGIVLINMIKNKKMGYFQATYFFTFFLQNKKNFIDFVRKHIRRELKNKEKNEINKKILFCLFEKKNPFKYSSTNQINQNYLDYMSNLSNSIELFNNFVISYVTSNEYNFIYRMKNYMQNCKWTVKSKNINKRKGYDYNFYKSLFRKRTLLNLYKFFPDLGLITNIILDFGFCVGIIKRIHYAFSFIFLSYNSITEILFNDKKDLFKKEFIPQYKVII